LIRLFEKKMATQVLTNAKIWFDAVDLSGDFNSVAIEKTREVKDATVFGHTTKGNKPGLRSAKFSASGYVDLALGRSDVHLFNEIKSVSTPIIVSPDGGEVTEAAYFFNSVLSKFSHDGKMGDLFAFSIDAECLDNEPLVSGFITENNANITSSGNGSFKQLGSVAAGKRLYAMVQVLSVTGPSSSASIFVHSDNSSAFASPATQITFAPIGGAGSLFASVPGPITDDFFRLNYTITGASPVFYIVAAIGIL
jgi:hypothetical protein